MASRSRTTTEKSLDALAKKLEGCASLRSGSIAFRLTGRGGGDYDIECGSGSAKVRDAERRRVPDIEIIGTPAKVRALITGDKDPIKVFFTGGIRVRGDIRYASDLAVELGLLAEPL